MDLKPDGRKYSRITRRSVAIITHIEPGTDFTIGEIAHKIHDAKLPEFFLSRFNRQMSISRTRAYVRYLVDLGVIAKHGNKYILNFRHRSSDGEWAQALSDRALLHLANILEITPNEAPDLLEEQLNKFHANNQLPIVGAIVTSLGIEGARSQEIFKWSLYLFTDGETCPLDIRQYPVLQTRD
jgi:hypothetical protein